MRFFISILLAASAHAQVLTAAKILGGTGNDVGTAVAVDSQGNVFVTGTTTSADFPLVNSLFSKIADPALRVSTDGRTFTPVSLNVPSVQALAASSDGQTLLAGAGNSIYRSVDAGATWTATAAFAGPPVALAIDPVDPHNAYVVVNPTNGAIFYRSIDGGVTWSSPPGGAHAQQSIAAFARILIDPQNPATLYTYFGNTLYRSPDRGTTWQAIIVSAPFSPTGQDSPNTFALAPSQPQTLYAATPESPPLKSTDGGATWQFLPIVINPGGANDLAVDPNDPNTFWFADGKGIQRSKDGGATAQVVMPTLGDSWLSITIDPADSTHIFATDYSHVYASLDGGATWNTIAVGQFNALLATPQAMYAAGSATPTMFLAKLDPTLTQVLFSTFIGPANPYGPSSITIDASGNPLVTGVALSPDFPTTPNALQRTWTSPSSGFAAKLSADGKKLLYSTFLAGITPGEAAFDAAGNAVIAGSAVGTQPLSANAFETAAPGVCTRTPVGLNLFPPATNQHAYVFKLSADGSSLLDSTFITGSCGDIATAVKLDASGNAWITGFTYSLDFPVTAGAMTPKFPATQSSGFLSELSPDGSHLLYSTYFGGGALNVGNALALDHQGNVYVAGYTQAAASAGALSAIHNGCAPIISIGPAFDQSYNRNDGFVLKLPSNGAAPTFLATIGGSCADTVGSLSIDGSGNIWITGATQSDDFPSMAPIGALGPGTGGFLAEIDPSGSKLLFSTFTNNGAVAADSNSGTYFVTSTPKTDGSSVLAAHIDGGQILPLALDSIQLFAPQPSAVSPVFTPTQIAPGQLIVINGRGIGPATRADAQLTSTGLPNSLAGVQVFFDGIPAALFSAQASRIVLQAPFELDGKTSTNIQVKYNGQTSNTFPAVVVAQNINLLVIVNANGTVNSASNPAPIGSVVTVYITGAGQMNPPGIDGGINSNPAIAPAHPLSISIDSTPVQPLFVGAAPQESSGVVQINLLAIAPIGGFSNDSFAIANTNGSGSALGTIYVK